MKYIIMAGGVYEKWKKPRHLTDLCGEPIIVRTIRLLRECGVVDIAISTNSDAFDDIGVPVLKHKNGYLAREDGTTEGYWSDAFYIVDEPVCYLFGDVVFSQNAIKTIVEIDTDDIEFFASAPPFADEYVKPWAEPFALKVVDTDHLRKAIRKTIEYHEEGQFLRKPIMWELWQVIKNTPLNHIYYTNYTVINDFTCDIDSADDVLLFAQICDKIRGK